MSEHGVAFIANGSSTFLHLHNEPQKSHISNAEFYETVLTAFSSQAVPVHESQPDQDEGTDCREQARDIITNWVRDKRIDSQVTTIPSGPSELEDTIIEWLSVLSVLDDLTAQLEGQTEGRTEDPDLETEDHQGRTTQGGTDQCSVM